jgi:protein SCO1/2
MNNVAEALRQLSDAEKARVQVLFVTVDPERDNVERLEKYSGFFHANIIGLSGSIEQIKRVAGAYGVEFFKQRTENEANYEVIHTSLLFLINGDGELSDIMSHKTAPEDISIALRQWFNQE